MTQTMAVMEGLFTYQSEEEKVALLDNLDFLKRWGYTKNACSKCGRKNSQLDGRLLKMNCCNDFYYCNGDCADSDLENHKKSCKNAGPLLPR